VSPPSRPLEATAEGDSLIISLRVYPRTSARLDFRRIEADGRHEAEIATFGESGLILIAEDWLPHHRPPGR
jgi:hypothetical protein